MPRPLGLSGWVTTRGTENPASTSFSRVGTAKAGVPQKTRLREAGIGRQTSDLNRFADARGLTPDVLLSLPFSRFHQLADFALHEVALERADVADV